MIELVAMTLVGGGLLCLGIYGVRTRVYETGISPIEAVILKTTGAEPLPLSDGDRAWGRATAWASVIFGSITFLFGLILVAATLFEAE